MHRTLDLVGQKFWYLCDRQNQTTAIKDRVDLHSPYCRYLRHPFVVSHKYSTVLTGILPTSWLSIPTFTIGLAAQCNLFSKASPYLPVSFRQRDANIANLSASAWA